MEEEIKKIKLTVEMYNLNRKQERLGFGNKKVINTKREELRKDLAYFIDNGVVIENSLGFLMFNAKAFSQLTDKKNERGV